MYKCFFKRVFDLIISFVALIVLSPLFIVLIIVGIIVMKGNPFFVQKRPGKNEKIFKLIKFRSMTEKKDANGDYLPDDERMTPYGEWIRSTSLDELPELINILKGDMAIVGPRPLLIEYLTLYNEEQKHRHDVRPGLTGLAQINGRFNILWKDKLAYDSEYARNVTMLGDIKIILKTIMMVFERENVENDVMGSWYPFLGNDVEDQQIAILKEKNKEIGSSFWNVEVCDRENNIFPKSDIRWFISGRAALNHILNDILDKNHNIKSAELPSWCCETMIEPFIKNGINVSFYSCVLENNKIIKKINNNSDILLNMNYFGFENNDIDYKGIVIKDVTHSIFTKESYKADYVYGSLRKWSGFATAGFAYCRKGFAVSEINNNCKEYEDSRKKEMNEKMKYINGETTKRDFYQQYLNNEANLNDLYNFCSSKEEMNKARVLDVERIRNIRRENAKELLNTVFDYAIFKNLDEIDCPLFVPIIVPNGKRDELQKYLIDKKIYCPKHWQISSLHILNDAEKYIYDNELSLICDQRYTIDDMRLISSHLNNFLKG